MKFFKKFYLVLIYILLYAPIAVLIVFSFNQSRDLVNFTGFTLKWYRELFANSTYLPLLKNTLILAVSSSLIATVVGTAAALGITRMRRRARNAVIAATNIPMTNPEIVTGVSLALLFVFIGALLKTNNVFGFVTMLIAHVTFNLPYVILSVLSRITQMDRYLTDAALDLGCTPVQTFFRVTLPEILPGVVSGMTMAFLLSLDDFVISYFVSGTSFTTLPIYIYSETKKPMSPTVYALFTLMFLAILTLLVLSNLLGREKKDKTKT